MARSGARLAVDRSVPGLIVKIGAYPLHHGGVGAIRSLGRLGVPMYAVTEDRFTPAAACRYLCGRFVWPTTGREEPERLVAGLLRIGRRIGRPAVLLPTDDEAAVLIAEHAEALTGPFLFPRPAPGLPRRLASKQGLHELCATHGVPSPAAVFPASYPEIEAYAGRARFPVVAKNREAFLRRSRPAVAGTTRITGREHLLDLARDWGPRPAVVLQEYLPREQAEDWIVHACFAADGAPLALFTGVKVRSWPPHAGMTACAWVVDNPELARQAARFARRIGFAGTADLDWRFDRRDGRYKLLDFNPRMGAQFRLFETTAGVDVVRAQHLHLTGRAVPEGVQRAGRRFVVENVDLPARLAYGGGGNGGPHVPARPRGTETAWFAADDPLPFLAMLARSAVPGARHLWQLHRAARRAATSRPPRSDAPPGQALGCDALPRQAPPRHEPPPGHEAPPRQGEEPQ
ncbi:ATP-grasp domain-containing protein [Streptomyces sp. NRRL S-1448]|uniref:carboxylate--amine ligase n=1 Tax=Streptomyces sp. NRRL S-1448 TaxID=1463883 RepID=UPI000AB8C921|nr:ATP-grasp domain-containing protein [Streptomyces sp. NRRL S-1448]